MGNEWYGGEDEETTFVDTGTIFAQVRRSRPATRPKGARGKFLKCGTLKDDETLCKRVAPCPEHYPREGSQETE